MAKRKGKNEAACMPTMDKDWQAQDDARELMRIGEISRDPARASKAVDVLRSAVEFGKRIEKRGQARSKTRKSSRR